MFDGVKSILGGISNYVSANRACVKTPNLNRKSNKFTEDDYAEIRKLKEAIWPNRKNSFKLYKQPREKKKYEFVKISSLPENFAEEVLDLEIKIERGKFSMSDVDRLVYLYSVAIEHYEGTDQDKHATFYQRTQRLLNKPSVFEVMKSQRKISRNKKSQLFDEDPTIRKLKEANIYKTNELQSSKSFYTPCRAKLEMDLLLMQEKKNQKKSDILIRHRREASLKNELLENDIETQKRNFEMRLLKRKMQLKASAKKNLFPKIGFKEDWVGEYSSITSKFMPSFTNESWAEENNILLKEIDSTRDKTESTIIKENANEWEEDKGMDLDNIRVWFGD
jgi:hypothetical protein